MFRNSFVALWEFDFSRSKLKSPQIKAGLRSLLIKKTGYSDIKTVFKTLNIQWKMALSLEHFSQNYIFNMFESRIDACNEVKFTDASVMSS